MIRFMDGFDRVYAGGSKLRYNAFTQTFGGGTQYMPGGRDGFGAALDLPNTGFGYQSWETVFDQQGVWGFHMDVARRRASIPDMIIWQARNSIIGGSYVGLRTRSTGYIDVVDLAGHVAATSSRPIPNFTPPTGAWFTLEFKYDNGAFELRMDNATVARGSVAVGTGNPDRISFRSEQLGNDPFAIDNYVVWDGQRTLTDQVVDFLGRVRISSYYPTQDELTEWIPKTGAVQCVQLSEPGGPDGDATYVKTPAAGLARELFAMSPANTCYGKVLAVAWNICAKPVTGSQIVIPICKLAAGITTAGAGNVVAPVGDISGDGLINYATYQAIAPVNPSTGSTWIDSQITAGEFGFEGTPGGNLWVTQFVLEKLVSLTEPSYECGGASSYAF